MKPTYTAAFYLFGVGFALLLLAQFFEPLSPIRVWIVWADLAIATIILSVVSRPRGGWIA